MSIANSPIMLHIKQIKERMITNLITINKKGLQQKVATLVFSQFLTIELECGVYKSSITTLILFYSQQMFHQKKAGQLYLLVFQN